MIVISQYRQEKRNGAIHICSEESSVCPICLCDLKVIGSRKRGVIEPDGRQQIYIIRRLRCNDCRTIHHELPDLLIPFKRHCTATIEQVIAEPEPTTIPTTPNAARRIKQWWSVMGAYFMFIIEGLEAKLGVALNIIPRPRNIVRAAVNSHNWAHTHSVLCLLRS